MSANRERGPRRGVYLVMAVPDAILDKIPHLPESPGVYLWRDARREGAVRRQGEAAAVARAQLRRGGPSSRASRRARLMLQVAALDTIVVPTEAHALILEANLIKEYKPRFNIALRDDKSYPYIKVTVQEPFPRVWVTRRLQNDGARYFGPYTDVGAMRRSLDVVKRLFTVRSCNYDMPAQMPERPVPRLPHRPVQGAVHPRADAGRVRRDDRRGARLSRRASRRKSVRKLRERMALAAESLDFERAAELRDVLAHLETMEEPTVVLEVEGGDRDVDRLRARRRRRGDRAAAHSRRQAARARSPVRRERRRASRTPTCWRRISPARIGCSRSARRSCSFRSTSRIAPSSRSRSSAPDSTCRSVGRRRELIDLAQQNARHLLEEARLTGESDRGARRRSRVRAAAPARPAEGAARRSSASTSRTRRARTPSRRASGSRTAGRIAPSIASSR